MSVGIRKEGIWKIGPGKTEYCQDAIAVEEPLEISVRFGPVNRRETKTLAVLMRTPGDDELLVRGFCFTEQIIRRPADLIAVRHYPEGNRMLIELSAEAAFQPEQLQRHIYTTSSCGVCGKTSIDHLQAISAYPILPAVPQISGQRIYGWSKILDQVQSNYQATGSMHACALLELETDKIDLKEDVGRHNAMDKLVGHFYNDLPLSGHALLLSGRASFELVQKAALCGLPIIASIGAPSSLAIDLADEHMITLIGFIKTDSYNIYSHPERLYDLDIS